MKVYKIRNKKTQELWSDTFNLERTAKAAYTQKTRWPNKHKFDEQNEYEIVEYELREVKVIG